jgi:hypothetical protein
VFTAAFSRRGAEKQIRVSGAEPQKAFRFSLRLGGLLIPADRACLIFSIANAQRHVYFPAP